MKRKKATGNQKKKSEYLTKTEGQKSWRGGNLEGDTITKGATNLQGRRQYRRKLGHQRHLNERNRYKGKMRKKKEYGGEET